MSLQPRHAGGNRNSGKNEKEGDEDEDAVRDGCSEREVAEQDGAGDVLESWDGALFDPDNGGNDHENSREDEDGLGDEEGEEGW